MAHVASHAGVGVATLYRRYASRDALVAEDCGSEERARDRGRRPAWPSTARGWFPWGAFVGFMTASVASGMGALWRRRWLRRVAAGRTSSPDQSGG